MTAFERYVQSIRQLVRQRTGLTESGGRDVATAVLRRMRAESHVDPAAYASLVARDASVFDALIHDLTVGETYFLREAEQLEYVRRHVLPALTSGRDVDAPLRIWSAGCATGEEAYTLSMLLNEAGLHDRSLVIGTDIAAERLRRARHGAYTRWSFRGVPDAVTRRWFDRTRDGLRVTEELRDIVRFHTLNLLDPDWTPAGIRPGSIDLLLCRNVLIYFDAETSRRVAQRLVEALVPGGWLLLGASDPWLAGVTSCEALVTGAGVIYRKPVGGSSRARVPVLRPTAMPTRDAAPVAPPTTTRGATATATPASSMTTSPRAATPSAAPPTPSPRATPPSSAPSRDVVERADATVEVIARVRALADRNELDAARRACAEALELHPDVAELRALEALLLLEAGHAEAAADAARAALYLDPRLVAAHLTLGGARARLGRAAEAVAAFRTAERLLADVAPDTTLGGGALAGELAELARAQIRLLEVGA